MTNANTVRQALAHVPAHNRETWVRMGMAVKSELGEDGFDIWSEWSQQDESYSDRDALSVWKSIKPSGRVTGSALFHEAQQHGFKSDSKPQPPTPEEIAGRERKVLEAEAEREQARAGAAAKAAAIWKAATHAPDDHPYLVRRGIKANGAKLHKGALLIPMCSDGKIHSLQFINTDGGKKFLIGGRVAGCYFSIGTTKDAAALCIAEGFATGATIREATGYPVAVAFNAGNLLAVAKTMCEKFPGLPLILCADDDSQTEGNPGLTKATEAARAMGGLLAKPDFGTDRPDKASDFNDLHQAQGMEAVKRAIAGALDSGDAMTPPEETNGTGAVVDKVGLTSNANKGGNANAQTWPMPQPLTAKIEAEPYPIDALPDTIRAAVEEVGSFVKAPVPLVASSAIAALSLAIQAHTKETKYHYIENTESWSGI
jgi:putative DNA primase/helicase